MTEQLAQSTKCCNFGVQRNYHYETKRGPGFHGSRNHLRKTFELVAQVCRVGRIRVPFISKVNETQAQLLGVIETTVCSSIEPTKVPKVPAIERRCSKTAEELIRKAGRLRIQKDRWRHSKLGDGQSNTDKRGVSPAASGSTRSAENERRHASVLDKQVATPVITTGHSRLRDARHTSESLHHSRRQSRSRTHFQRRSANGKRTENARSNLNRQLRLVGSEAISAPTYLRPEVASEKSRTTSVGLDPS